MCILYIYTYHNARETEKKVTIPPERVQIKLSVN